MLAGDTKGGLRLFMVPALKPRLELEFHRDAITGLAWSGDSMLSGDAAGRVAVWRFTPPAD